MFWDTIPIIGTVIKKTLGIIDKAVPDKDLREKLKTQVTLELSQMDHSEIEKLIENRAKIVVAEAQGHSWLQRNWRPMLMTVFTFIIAWNYAVVPVLSCVFTQLKPAIIPPDMWQLLKIGVGGYIVGRSGEKIAQVFKLQESK